MNTIAERTADQLILEGIVTTKAESDAVNIAPMGPVVDRTMTWLRLRPFQSSTTYANLKNSGSGIFHVTDDAWLLATAALDIQSARPALRRLDGFPGYIIENSCRWYAFEVESLDDRQERVEITCRVVQHGEERPFFGWNRATHSVLEAAILATRIKLLPKSEIVSQLEPLRIIVDKTASDHERRAFRFVEDYVKNYEA